MGLGRCELAERGAASPIVAAQTSNKGLRVIGLTSDQRLVSFNSNAPKLTFKSIGTIAGLSGDTGLVGIDYRVQDGLLYGVGDAGDQGQDGRLGEGVEGALPEEAGERGRVIPRSRRLCGLVRRRNRSPERLGRLAVHGDGERAGEELAELKGFWQVVICAGIDSINAVVSDGFDRATVERIAALIAGSEWKRRQGAIGPKITGMAFGRDRRLPITNKFR